jgi:bacterioferritin
MITGDLDKERVIDTLNRILELELAGVVRYTHYSMMVFGHGRIPIVSWMQAQAEEGLKHAGAAGEYVTSLGGHPSLKIGTLLETHKHNIDDLLAEALEHEQEGLQLYYQLLELVAGKSVTLEEYAREMIRDEEDHTTQVEKMIRRPGELIPVR